MNLFGFSIALFIVWGAMWLVVSRFVPAGQVARNTLCAGYGLLFGMILVSIVMRVHSAVGLEFSPVWINLSVLVCAACAWIMPKPVTAPSSCRTEEALVSRAEKLLIALCLGLIATRLVMLGLESLSRPVFAWDSKQHWTKQARVFYELGKLVPFVTTQEWLELGGQGAYTNMHPDYPITTPLLQAWTAATLGEWRHDLVGLPWLFCFISLGLVFFAQSRVSGASVGVAMAATYMVLSMPYLNIQVALPGYADVFMGTVYLSAVAAFYGWTVKRETWQAALALSAALACVLVKKEGLFWLLSFVPGMLIVLMGKTRGLAALGSLAVAVALFLWLIPKDFSIIGLSAGSMDLGYRPEAITPILKGLFVDGNWHLASYIVVGVLLVYLVSGARNLDRCLPLIVTVFSSLILYMLLYTFTRYASAAITPTSFNRVGMHLYPSLLFLGLVLYLEVSAKSRS